MIFFRTARLAVRNWQDGDLDTLYAIYNDADVMRFFPRFIDRAECRERLNRWRAIGNENRLTFAPLVRTDMPDEGMIGFAGLLPITDTRLPCVGGHEIGWTVAKKHWRKGFAREAAFGWIEHAFKELGLKRLNAFIAEPNDASCAVARSVGMTPVADADFEHPNVPDGPLRRHRLYEITRS